MCLLKFIVDEDRQKKWGLAPETDSSRSKVAAENGDNHAIENHHSENHTVENHHNTNNVRSRAEGRSGGGPKCDVVQVTVSFVVVFFSLLKIDLVFFNLFRILYIRYSLGIDIVFRIICIIYTYYHSIKETLFSEKYVF